MNDWYFWTWTPKRNQRTARNLTPPLGGENVGGQKGLLDKNRWKNGVEKGRFLPRKVPKIDAFYTSDVSATSTRRELASCKFSFFRLFFEVTLTPLPIWRLWCLLVWVVDSAFCLRFAYTECKQNVSKIPGTACKIAPQNTKVKPGYSPDELPLLHPATSEPTQPCDSIHSPSQSKSSAVEMIGNSPCVCQGIVVYYDMRGTATRWRHDR